MADLAPARPDEPRLEHVTVATADFAAAFAFYDPVLRAAGFELAHELVDEEEDDPAPEAAAWGVPGRPAFLWLVLSARPTSGSHLRLRVTSRAAVDRVHRAALDAGGTEHSAPRRWAIFRAGEYGATVRDPAGNLIEVVSGE